MKLLKSIKWLLKKQKAEFRCTTNWFVELIVEKGKKSVHCGNIRVIFRVIFLLYTLLIKGYFISY